MTVKFYNLKINPQNRFYNKVAYENNINDTNVIETIDLNKEIIPNQVFYLKRDNKSDLVKLMGCTYITYEINGTKFGGFITNIQLLAPKGKTIAVQHSVDWWYFTLLNELPFDMHGKCTRAHVNDIDKTTKYPLMDYTTTSQETPINDFNIRYESRDLIRTSGIKVNGKITQDFTFLYIFFPQFTENIGGEGSIYPLIPPTLKRKDTVNYYYIGEEKYPNVGFTCVFLLNLRTGCVVPLQNTIDYELRNDKFYFSQISSSYIATMCLFDGFICETENYDISYFEDETSAHASVTFNDSSLSMGLFITREAYTVTNVDELSLPIYLSFTKKNNEIVHKASIYLTRALFDTYDNKEEQHKWTNYNDYLERGIQKIKYTPYDRYLLNNNEINKYKIKFYGEALDSVAAISLVGDLSCFVFDYVWNIDLQPIMCTNQFIFKPDTVNDYWTKLNARLTANSAKQIKLSGAQAITSGVFKIASGISSSITSGISGGVGTLDALTNPKKLGVEALGSGVGGVGGVLNGIGGVASGIQGIQSGDLLIKQGNMLSEIANKQLTDGNISMDNNTGAYLYGYRTSGFIETHIYIEYRKKLETLTDLHRFGYNTFLQLDEIYKNHQREHFNYFQASDIEITGLPLFIASDLQNMFLSGVHLWTRDIEEFENGTNYQLGLWD